MRPGFGGGFDSTERWDYVNIEEISRGTASTCAANGCIPTELADKLPALRYTGSHRQSAGMMVSIALSAYLEKAAHDLTM